MGKNGPAIFLGNLRTDIRITFLKENIAALFTLLGIDYLRKSHISVIKRSYATFCFVALGTEEEVDDAIANLDELLQNGGIPNSVLNSLVEQGFTLKVGSRNQFGDTAGGNSTETANVEDDEEENYFYDDEEPSQQKLQIPIFNNNDCIAAPARTSAHGITKNGVGVPPWVYRDVPRDVEATSTTKDPLSRVMKGNIRGGAYSDSALLTSKGAAAASTAGKGVQPKVKKYVLGQKLGNETRNVEYKCGQGNYKDKHFFRHVSVYMSAFLNSDGGTLLIGVDDDGVVQGLQLCHKEEDSLRTKIDTTIKDIRPDVFPRSYAVHFVPVFDSIGKILKEVKVIEIKIQKGDSSQLYQTGRGEVFIRRDGSVQELSASAIQEYTRIRVIKELEKKGEEMKNMEQQDADLKHQFVVLQQQLADIKIQMSEAEHQRLQALQTEQQRDRLEQEVQALSNKVVTLQREKRTEKEDDRGLRRELEELRREKKTWQEKGLRRNKSKTCVVS